MAVLAHREAVRELAPPDGREREPARAVRPGTTSQPAHVAPAGTMDLQALPGQLLRLQRTLGNRNVVEHLGRLSNAAGPRVQREPGGDEEDGDEVKIWDPDAGENGRGAVVVVIFVRQEGDKVWYRRKSETASTKGTSAKKKSEKGRKAADTPLQTISSQLVFPASTKDPEIKREYEAIQKQADEGVKGDKGVISYVIDVVNQHADEHGLDIKPDKRKVLEVLTVNDYLKAFLFDLEGLKEALEDDDVLDNLIDDMGRTSLGAESQVSISTGGSSSGSEEWKSDKMKRLKAALVASMKGKPGFEKIEGDSTLHHKISRSWLGDMLALLKQAPSSKGTQMMWDFIARVQKLSGKGDAEKALDNWVANIELGVIAWARAEGDDPGERFDGSYPKGMATPRTAALEEASLLITSSTDAAKVDWMEVAGLLTQAQDQHEQLTKKQGRGHDELSEPNLGQWTEKDGKFARDKKDPTATSGPANSSTRTTSPKDAKAVAAITTPTVEKKEKKVVENEKTFEKEKRTEKEEKGFEKEKTSAPEKTFAKEKKAPEKEKKIVAEKSSEKGSDTKTTLDVDQKRKLTQLLKANNCLINAIANEAGVTVSYGQLVTIRLRLGSIGEMLIANGKTIAAIMDVLGITRGVVVCYRDRMRSSSKTEKIPSEEFGDQSNPVVIVHTGNNHFVPFYETQIDLSTVQSSVF